MSKFPGFAPAERVMAGGFALLAIVGAAIDIRAHDWPWVVTELIFAIIMAAIAIGAAQ